MDNSTEANPVILRYQHGGCEIGLLLVAWPRNFGAFSLRELRATWRACDRDLEAEQAPHEAFPSMLRRTTHSESKNSHHWLCLWCRGIINLTSLSGGSLIEYLDILDHPTSPFGLLFPSKLVCLAFCYLERTLAFCFFLESLSWSLGLQVLVQKHLRKQCVVVRNFQELLARRPWAYYLVVLLSRGVLRDPSSLGFKSLSECFLLAPSHTLHMFSAEDMLISHTL